MARMAYIVLFLFCFAYKAHATTNDVDSTEESEILFGKLTAITSSKIVHFSWEVDKESKGSHFVIEKSIDKINWREVNRVVSIGDHKERHTYQLSEINFAEGVQEYFRIARIDEYGVRTDLDMVTLDQPVLSNVLVLPFPKNVKHVIVISYDSLISSKGRLYIRNEEGEIVDERYLFFDKGYNRLLLNYKHYNRGVYQIFIKDEFDNRIVKSFRVN